MFNKRAFVAKFIYVVIGLMVAIALLPTFDNFVNTYTGSYASLVKLIVLVVIAGLIFVSLSFMTPSRQ